MPSNPLCKQINLTDALPTLHELIVVSGQWSVVSGQRSVVRAGGWNGHLARFISDGLSQPGAQRWKIRASPSLTHPTQLPIPDCWWAVPSNPLCKQINLTDALPTLHELIVVSGQRSAVSGQRSAVSGQWSEPVGGMGILPVSFPTGCFNQALRGGKSGRARP
ncbi:MAG: hypothetical protein F6K56_25025 [Moorea sp. SIO3G5]|nr:hypothetical protein [Moorena sp. SIO3G5]